ncbi:MAG: hypothetical protein GF411_02720 [Candidatus Lokiarchaeota archaeon]|nr:hypothetical protein [Candidatus Lokiarchaeota archaeon]
MMPSKRPLTQREIKKKKQVESKSAETMTVYNPSRAKMISIQVRDPSKDFYLSEQTIRIGPGKKYTNKKSFFNPNQLKNLGARGDIKVLS